MIVSMWMTRDLVTIEPATPITEAAALMAGKPSPVLAFQ